MQLKDLKAKRAKILDEAKAMVAMAEKADRELTDAEKTGIKDAREIAARLGSEIEIREGLDTEHAALSRSDVRRSLSAEPLAHDPQAAYDITKRQRQAGRLTHFKTKEAAMRFGIWFMAVNGNPRAQRFCQENGLDFRAIGTEGVNSDGGYLVPDEFDSTVIDLKEAFGVARMHVKVVPMARETKRVPRRTGGLTGYWVGEAAQITESTKTWDSVNLTAKKLGAISRYTSELNEDAAINIGDDLAGEIAYAFASAEDDALFNGDGTSTYGGVVGLSNVSNKFLNLGSTISSIAGLFVGTGNAYSELTFADFQKTMALLPHYADVLGRVYWFVHRNFYYNVMVPLAQTTSGGLNLNDLLGSTGGKPPMYLGYPVQFSQKMVKAEANSQVCALLGNMFLAVMLGDRRQTSISVSSEAYVNGQSLFERDEIAIRGTERIDINVHDVGNYTSVAASKQPGPIVGLITAAS